MIFEIRKIEKVDNVYKSYRYALISLDKKYKFNEFDSIHRCNKTLQKILRVIKKNPDEFGKRLKKLCDKNIFIHRIELEYEDHSITREEYLSKEFIVVTEVLRGYSLDNNDITEDYDTDLSCIDKTYPFFIVSYPNKNKNLVLFQIICSE